jgi:hypothetical protein
LEGFFCVDGLENPFGPTGEEVGLVMVNGFSTMILQAVVTQCDMLDTHIEYMWVSSGSFYPVIEGKQTGMECFVFMEDACVEDPKANIKEGLKLIQKGMELL